MKLKINKAVLIAAILAGFADPDAAIKAQSFQEGTAVINAGIGIGSSLGYYSGSSRTPLLSLTGEYGFMKAGPGVIGLGLALGYQGASYSADYAYYSYKEKWTTTTFGVRGTYHPDFLNSDKYDVYGVVQISYNHIGYSFTSSDPSYNYNVKNTTNSGVGIYFLAGGRYYFTKAIGAYAEVGYDVSFVKLGLTIKIIDKKQ